MEEPRIKHKFCVFQITQNLFSLMYGTFCFHVYPDNGVRRVEDVLRSVITRVSRSRMCCSNCALLKVGCWASLGPPLCIRSRAALIASLFLPTFLPFSLTSFSFFFFCLSGKIEFSFFLRLSVRTWEVIF